MAIDPTKRRQLEPTKIVILGGGFGGLYTARELEKQFTSRDNVRIILVNRENFTLFTPMLHEVAASDLDVTHIVNPLRKLLKRSDFFEGEVEAIDLAARSVTVAHGPDRHHHTIPYDHLVIALGCVTNYYNLPGLAETALSMKSLGDAIELRNRLISLLEDADTECSANARREPLTILVAGGGFAGVETLAGINDFAREALRYYRHLRGSDLRVVLVHPGEVILPELAEPLGHYARRKLTERGVEVLTSRRVTSIRDDVVTLSDGTTMTVDLLVWTAGTAPNPVLDALTCAKDRGRITVNEFLELPDFPGVWALGDCASVPDPRTGKPYPPTAQHALRQARVLAHNIAATISGSRKRPFLFKTIGQLASIGRRTGVANILGVNFSGFIAWWLWRTIYLSKLPRFERKARVALDWTLDLLFSKDIVKFQTVLSRSVSHNEHDPRSAEFGHDRQIAPPEERVVRS